MDMPYEFVESSDAELEEEPSVKSPSDAEATGLIAGLPESIVVEGEIDHEALATRPRAATREGASGLDINEAASTALADLVATPITKLTMAGIGTLEDGGGNEAAGELVDHFSEALQNIVDPARIPAGLVEKTVTHLVSAATATLGPIGPVVAIFAGKFAGELTHQVLDADRDPAGIQSAENAIELADAFADARIGRLAESEPFADYLNDMLGKPIEAIVSEDASAAASRKKERETGKGPAITAIIAAYEVRGPASESDSASPGDSTPVRLRPVSVAVLECIPAKAVVRRWRSDSYEYLLLSDGTVVKRFVFREHSGPWVWIKN
jgi:hypothetical protein